MKNLRFIHTADWHADADLTKHEKLVESLTQMLDYVKENKINAIIHAGDIWEKKQSYADKSGVPVVVEFLRELSKHVDFIFITKGNNSHDEPGSVSLLHQLEPNIYAYEYPVSLAIFRDDSAECPLQPVDILRDSSNFSDINCEYIVSLVPYPTKASFIQENSIDNNNADFIEKFEQIFELIGDVTKPYSCPTVLAFHGNVVGSRLSSGQTLISQDIMVAPSTLEKAQQHYYGLGHIHLRQFFKPYIGYSGSIYNKNWGEIEQKSFELVEFEKDTNDDWDFESKQIMLTAAHPMVKVDAEFKENNFHFDIIPPALEGNSEVRFRCKVKENDRKLITENRIEELKEVFGDDVKIEFNIIPDERESRSEQIMNCRSLLDEVTEYAKVTDQDFESIDVGDSADGEDKIIILPDSIKQKVLSFNEEEALV